jgi:serine/threonine protein phosphatase PrpC
MIKDNNIFIGNVGDSRALLLGENSINQVTNDHKPDDK